MIFKQVQEIIDGRKTQTRRVVKPDEVLFHIDGGARHVCVDRRLKWMVGRDYAVVSKRGTRGVMWEPGTGKWYVPDTPIDLLNGYVPLRVRVTGIRQEALWEITEADAIAEGVEPVHVSRSALIGPGMSNIQQALSNLSFVAAYRVLWDSINKAKGTRWADDPRVWVITFEVVR